MSLRKCCGQRRLGQKKCNVLSVMNLTGGSSVERYRAGRAVNRTDRRPDPEREGTSAGTNGIGRTAGTGNARRGCCGGTAAGRVAVRAKRIEFT